MSDILKSSMKTKINTVDRLRKKMTMSVFESKTAKEIMFITFEYFYYLLYGKG